MREPEKENIVHLIYFKESSIPFSLDYKFYLSEFIILMVNTVPHPQFLSHKQPLFHKQTSYVLYNKATVHCRFICRHSPPLTSLAASHPTYTTLSLFVFSKWEINNNKNQTNNCFKWSEDNQLRDFAALLSNMLFNSSHDGEKVKEKKIHLGTASGWFSAIEGKQNVKWHILTKR